MLRGSDATFEPDRTWIESQCQMPSLTVCLPSQSSNQASHLLIFTHEPLSPSHKYPLPNIPPAFSLARTWCLWWALRGKSVAVSCTSVLFLLYFCVCVWGCMPLSLPASSLMSFSRSPPGVCCHTRPARRWRSDVASCWIASPGCQSLRIQSG